MQKQKKSQKYWIYWLLLAPVSLLLTGMGLTITIEAGLWRFKGLDQEHWLFLGTAGLTCFNLGLVLLGNAVKYRVFYEYRLKKEQRSYKNDDSSEED